MSDPDAERLAERVRAVERAVTGSDRPPAELADAAEATDRIATLEERVDGVEERLAELEAATEALRGYVGNVRSVNEDVERRAEAALSMARSLRSGEERAEDGGTTDDGPTASTTESGDTHHGSPRNGRSPDRERWSEATGPWEPAGATPTGADSGTQMPAGSDGGGDSGTKRTTPDRNAPEWPTATEEPTGGTDGEWPREGMDVERAQPWAVPDPGAEEWDHDDDRTLLDRVREAL
jgi:hypothetical protein